MGYRAEPMSREELRLIAKKFRKILGIENVLHVNVLKILELVMPTLFEGFYFELAQKYELPKNRHADTDVVNRIIRIREDIYEKAYHGDGQARMTVMHEIAHYNAVANILRTENGGDLTYFLEYYLTLLSQAVEARRKKKQDATEELQAAEKRLAGTALASAFSPQEAPPAGAPAQQVTADPSAERFSADGYVDFLGEEDSAQDGNADTTATPEGEPPVREGGEVRWGGEAKAREKVLALMSSSGSLMPIAGKIMLRYLDQGRYVFSTEELKAETGFKGKQTLNLIYSLREKGIVESIGKSESNAMYAFYCGELSDSDYTSEMIHALNDLFEGTQSVKDKRLAAAIRNCLPRGYITSQDYDQAGDASRWQDDMKLAEQMGFVRKLSRDRYIIMRSAQPCFERLDSGQKKRARLMYDSFGEGTFSLGMVVATLDYSSSTASAYLHQFTLLRILDCRKEDVNVYQFLVNPREHPEVFEDVA